MVLFSRDSIVEWTGDNDPSKRALCLDFPTPTPEADPWFQGSKEAMQICNGTTGGPVCPVRNRCLMRAMVNNERHGVWGGLQHHDRKRIKDENPNDPEKWTWQPPTARPRARRRRRRAADSRTSSTPAEPQRS
jgi:hypothetical protein